MKKVRFVVFIAIVVALMLGSFVIVPNQKSVAGALPTQAARTAFNIPAISPFFFSAGAQVLAAGDISTESTPGYACKLMTQTPADWTVMKSRQSFDVAWNLKNVGSKVWGIHGIDVRYRGDTRMHTNVPDLFDIPQRVAPGQRFTLKLDMVAPKLAGYYVSNWGLYVGSQVFCKFYLVIYV